MVMPKYALVTAARNEENYIDQTLRSVVDQEILPEIWYVVDDNSTDSTARIIRNYSKQYSFIKLIQLKNNEKRNFACQVWAQQEGYSRLGSMELDFIGMLDGDIRLSSNYYQIIMKRFELNKGLGIAGGWIHEEKNGEFKPRRTNNPTSVPGGIQLFRKQCFLDIGSGYTPMKYGGMDWLAELRARYLGWETHSFSDIRVDHLKAPSNSFTAAAKRSLANGFMDYTMGEAWVHEIIKCSKRISQSPWILGTFLRMSAYIYAFLTRETVLAEKEIVDFLHKERSQAIFNKLSPEKKKRLYP